MYNASDFSPPNYKNLTGLVFGRWTVIHEVPDKLKQRLVCLCKCECGTERVVYKLSLIKGVSKSCGCVSTERISKLRLTHGKTKTPLFKLWDSIKDRCYNKNNKCYKNYGGRGIGLYEPWIKNFELFEAYIIKELGKKPKQFSLDRINNNVNYEPGNLRWASNKQQANNKTTNKFIEYRGEVKTIVEWCSILNLIEGRVRKRLNKGWSVEDAFNKPPRMTKRTKF